MSWFLFLPRAAGGVTPPPTTPPGSIVLPDVAPVLSSPPTPLVYWGTADTFSGWTAQGVTITTGQSDPWGGTTAAKIAGLNTTVNAYSGAWGASKNFDLVASCWVKQGSGFQQVSQFMVVDVTASVTRAVINVQWNGDKIASYASSAGTALAPVAVGGGWYLLRIVTSGIVSTNSHRTYIFPGGNDIIVAARPTVLLGTLDSARPWSEPRPGYSALRGASGLEDAWSYGHDYYLTGASRYVPALDTDTPEPISGWFNGNGEHATAGWGIARMMQDGLDKQPLYVCPHRAFATSRVYTAYLAGPEDGQGALEGNGLLSYSLTFRTTGGHFLGVVP